MALLISVLYLLLNIAILLLVAAIIWWFLRWVGFPLDPWVLKICQVILALLILILVVSWFAGVLPTRGVFGSFRTVAGAALAALSAGAATDLHELLNSGGA